MMTAATRRVANFGRSRTGDRDRTLVLLPPAGAGPAIYSLWEKTIAERVALVSPRLPGRENRMLEAPMIVAEHMVDEYSAVLERIPHCGPLYIYGHCFGALLACAVANRLSLVGRKPVKLVLSGLSAPEVPPVGDGGYVHTMSDEQILRRFDGDGKLPSQADARVTAIVIRLLRSDFQAIETWRPRLEPIDMPVVLLRGSADEPLSTAEGQSWRRLSGAPPRVRVLAQPTIGPDSLSSDVAAAVDAELTNEQSTGRVRT